MKKIFFLWLFTLSSQNVFGVHGETPESTYHRYLDLCEDDRISEAAFYFSRKIPYNERKDLAKKLYILIQRKGWMTVDKISSNNIINTSEEQEEIENTQKNDFIIGAIRIDEVDQPIKLDYQDIGGRQIWVFPKNLASDIHKLFGMYESRYIYGVFPQKFRKMEILGVPFIQWVSLALAIFATLFTSLLIFKTSKTFLFSLEKTNIPIIPMINESGIKKPTFILLNTLIFDWACAFLEIPFFTRVLFANFFKVIYTICYIIIIARLISIGFKKGIQRYHSLSGLSTVTKPVERSLNLVIYFLGFAYLLHSLGFDVSAVIAGLGIGGFAVALAGQKTIENLFGSFSLIMDQPIRVGEFCKFNEDSKGVVEDIGFRSTKLRTLDQTLVTVPNSALSQMIIENFSRRHNFRLFLNLGIMYSTPMEKVKTCIEELKKSFKCNTLVLSSPFRVVLFEFGPSSIDIQIQIYLLAKNYEEYLSTRHEVMFDIMEIMNSNKVQFAFPSQSLYIEDISQNLSEKFTLS